MHEELSGALLEAVMLGEAQAKQEDDVTQSRLTMAFMEHQERHLKEIEDVADASFGGMHAVRAKLASNYLSLKAYVATAAATFNMERTGTGFPPKFNALTDLLMSMWARSKLKNSNARVGVTPSAESTPLCWATPTPPPKDATSKGSELLKAGLIVEFSELLAELRTRWRKGLGRYLLNKIESSMYSRVGILESKQTDMMGKRGLIGAIVRINSKAVGLQGGKAAGLDDFGVHINAYRRHLKELLAQVKLESNIVDLKALPAGLKVDPPQWQGN
jgi:hypothetical protein